MSAIRLQVGVAALAIGVGGSCGPPSPPAAECIPVDDLLGDPAARLWCDGLWTPQSDPDVAWNGAPAGAGLPVCLPPESDGSCKACPVDEVEVAVEAELKNLYPEGADCHIEHWEIGCMRTPENTMKSLGINDNYCCFEVALWGPGCDDTP